VAKIKITPGCCQGKHAYPSILASHPLTVERASWLNAVENFFSKMTGSASAAASSTRSPTCRPPSMLISLNTMTAPSRSSGPNPPRPLWPNSIAFL
jgi:hypothetical protein